MTSDVVNIHASCVVLGHAGEALGAAPDAGVLLLGKSGAGKSDLALRLIAEGAVLVADDRCDLYITADALHARAPLTLAGLLEIRGVGIVTVPSICEARIALCVRCVSPEEVTRLPELQRYQPPNGLRAPERIWPPEIALAPFEASAPSKVLAATAYFVRA